MATSSADRGTPIFRFAPSPNGRLHLGHALSALTNARLAERFGGQLLLRIEDIDTMRCKLAFEQAIHDDLAWLGLRFEADVRRQSQHFADYAAGLERLRATGLIYPCFCSRQQIKAEVAGRETVSGFAWPRDPDGAPLYPGSCRALDPAEVARRVAAGEGHVLRLDIAAALARLGDPPVYAVFDAENRTRSVTANPARWGDAVLARKDVATSYHLSVIVDDALQGISHVVRGRDLEAATDIHVVLQRLLNLPTPLYHFHRLLIDAQGRKLSKSAMSESLADLRGRGVTATEIRRRLGFA